MIIERSKTAAFSASVLLHGGILAAIFLVAYAMKDLSPSPAADLYPFVMIGGSENSPSSTQPQTASASPQTTVSFTPPAPVVVEPRLDAPVKPTIVEKPLRQRLTADQPRQKPTTVRMTFGQYQALHPTAKPTPATAQALSSKPLAHVDINEVLGGSGAANSNSVNAPATTDVADNQLAAYESELLHRLRAALIKPPGALDALTTRVSFHLAADGTLSQVVIKKSSGDRAFDSAVLAAFSRVVSIGRVPTGKGEDLTLIFRMIEED